MQLKTARQPYHGQHRKLAIAIDLGTTYSGVSFALLDPGITPVIQGVTRFPAQQKVGGDSKIPSIIYYDQAGLVRAVGAEAMDEAFLEQAEDEEFIKVEWFKLHMRPKSLNATHITDADLPDLPLGKTVVDIFADFLKYLYKCTRDYIEESLPSGSAVWTSIQNHIDFILSHPNGWEGAQQAQMRRATFQAGLVSDVNSEQLHFVTEGEASLHFCIDKGIPDFNLEVGESVIIIDGGGGTIDLSAYRKTTGNKFEEIARPQCRLQGSIFVSRRAKAYLQSSLTSIGSRYANSEDVKHMTEVFDKSTKLSFRKSAEPAYIRFGSARDKDIKADIRSGQKKLSGETVASFFQPSIDAILEAVKEQLGEANTAASKAFLVGGFGASDWLFLNIQSGFHDSDLAVCRPDGHVNKAVADGAIAFYLDQHVAARVSRFTYGTECLTAFYPFDNDHDSQRHMIRTLPSGGKWLPRYFDVILKKGVAVREEQEFRCSYFIETSTARECECRAEILCYRGDAAPKWTDVNQNNFSTLCTIEADISAASEPVFSPLTSKFYHRAEHEIILLFGLTELKAQISWMENGREKRSPATVVYER